MLTAWPQAPSRLRAGPHGRIGPVDAGGSRRRQDRNRDCAAVAGALAGAAGRSAPVAGSGRQVRQAPAGRAPAAGCFHAGRRHAGCGGTYVAGPRRRPAAQGVDGGAGHGQRYA
ncbi:hypothetical protein G6F68_020295 [Rhizopus microsporus]|nr:hypothetical protein G6F68_020295 [Rhizopus microsporus]